MSQNQFVIPREMHAIEILEFGGPENLKSCMRQVPEILTDQVLIKVMFAGVNRPDLLQRQGNYKVPETASDIPGLEVSGIVVDLKDASQIDPSLAQNVANIATNFGNIKTAAENCQSAASAITGCNTAWNKVVDSVESARSSEYSGRKPTPFSMGC